MKVLCLLALAIAGWATLIGPRRLVVRHVELELPRWPPEQSGLRVALLSDLHVGSPHWGLERVRQLVATTNAEHPDVILLAGDYVIDGVKLGTKIDPAPIAAVLGELRAPLGVIAVLGNHDWANDGPRIRALFEARGIVVLANSVVAVEHGGGRFYVAGLAEAIGHRAVVRETLDEVPRGEASIVLMHEPDSFLEIDDRPSLTLAGHTHGGQIRLPLLGRPVLPSDYGERFAAGHIVERGRHMFVTTGIGTSIYPVRLGVPPELVILTLRGDGGGVHR